jgi:hypothetical protein
MKKKILIAIILALFVTLLAFFLNRDVKVPAEQTESVSTEHVYSSWNTTEFDKCVAAWLIVKFIDKDAKFVLYPQDTEITEGIVFDIPGAEWSRKHRKCTSDCIMESLNINDPVAEKVVEIAHQVELNFWQLDRFPQAQKCFDAVRGIYETTPDRGQGLEKGRLYIESLYNEIKSEEKEKL